MGKVVCGNQELDSEKEFDFVPGQGELCDALECACARMPKGEVALITVNGHANLLAPGKPETAGSASIDGPVVYHVEMLEHDQPASEDGPGGDSERLRFC